MVLEPGKGQSQSNFFHDSPFILSLSKDARCSLRWFDMLTMSSHHHEWLGMDKWLGMDNPVILNSSG